MDTLYTYGYGRSYAVYYATQMMHPDRQYRICAIYEDTWAELDGERLYLPSNHLIFLGPEEDMRIESGSNIEVVYFTADMLAKSFTDEYLRDKPFIDRFDDEQTVWYLLQPFIDRTTYENGIIPVFPHTFQKAKYSMEQIRDILTDMPITYWSCKVRSYIFDILSLINNPVEAMDAHHNDYDMASRVIDYVHGHYDDPITYKDIMEITGTDQLHTSAFFQVCAGMPFPEYLDQLRVTLASNYLAYTSLTITEISGRLGFFDQAHFSRVFKRIKKRSPLQYRKDTVRSRIDYFKR